MFGIQLPRIAIGQHLNSLTQEVFSIFTCQTVCMLLTVCLFIFFPKNVTNKLRSRNLLQILGYLPVQNFVPVDFGPFKILYRPILARSKFCGGSYYKTSKLLHFKDRSFCRFRVPERTVQSGDSLEKVIYLLQSIFQHLVHAFQTEK